MKRYHSQQNIDLEASPHCRRRRPEECLSRNSALSAESQKSAEHRENPGRIKSGQSQMWWELRTKCVCGHAAKGLEDIWVSAECSWEEGPGWLSKAEERLAEGQQQQCECVEVSICYLMRPDTLWERELRQREEDGIITGHRTGGRKNKKELTRWGQQDIRAMLNGWAKD